MGFSRVPVHGPLVSGGMRHMGRDGNEEVSSELCPRPTREGRQRIGGTRKTYRDALHHTGEEDPLSSLFKRKSP